jgi:protein-L-isoaspartate(D-aspartate) O-methyltransferase
MAYLLANLLGSAPTVLEIGTGSGYQTAVLASQCESVVTLEAQLIPGVAEKLPANVCMIRPVDGRTYDTGETFDGILVTFAAPKIESAWVKQLAEGGRLVVPLAIGGLCRISVFQKRYGHMQLIAATFYAPFTAAVGVN